MSKSLAASKELMQTYLSELLTEERVEDIKSAPVKEKQTQSVEKLLNKVTTSELTVEAGEIHVSTPKAESRNVAQSPTSVPIKAKVAEKKPAEVIDKAQVSHRDNAINEHITTRKSKGITPAKRLKSYREGSFQAMFFDVAGLIIAVPLIELGGIHNKEKTTSLIGKPDWFKGVMLHREAKINVVDTARWVMPEKCNEELMSAINYQYVIMLSNSQWGLSAENLVDTVTLEQNDVKWLESSNKRPWLAGLVKNRMCALLDVDSLIQLLEKGANITQE